VAVFTDATACLPRHLEHEERPQAGGGRRQPDLTGALVGAAGDGGTTAIQAMYHASSVLASCR
jgi:hypothetical protein